jgi:hypothetical protein
MEIKPNSKYIFSGVYDDNVDFKPVVIRLQKLMAKKKDSILQAAIFVATNGEIKILDDDKLKDRISTQVMPFNNIVYSLDGKPIVEFTPFTVKQISKGLSYFLKVDAKYRLLINKLEHKLKK